MITIHKNDSASTVLLSISEVAFDNELIRMNVDTFPVGLVVHVPVALIGTLTDCLSWTQLFPHAVFIGRWL